MCLSLLGTWSGEPWDPAHSNLSQLLISILAFIFTTEPLCNEPGLEGSGPRALQFYNAYIRVETLETAMLSALRAPPPEFAEVVRAHFRRAWHALVRPDLLAWAERHDLVAEGGAGEAGWQASQSQIHRLQWFRQAVGAGNYKKLMLASVARMDEAVAALGGVIVPGPAGQEAAEAGGGKVVAADIRDEPAGGGGKSDSSAGGGGKGGAAKKG